VTDNAISKARPKHLFKPGQSGNPKGMPAGTRHKATRAMESLLDGQGLALTQKAVTMALEGDPVAMRLCMERVLPARKDRPVNLRFRTEIVTASDAASAMAEVLAGVAGGELTPSEGQAVAGLIGGFVRTLETTQLEARIAALENEESQ
jgi:Family of unknown function (DUF5681)